jgi:glutaredoxin-like YruB-family protein
MAKKVIIYSTKTCGYCRAEKEYFDSKGIEYEDVDVGVDQEQARVMIEKSGQMGVPVTIVGEGKEEELIVGFDKERLNKLLEIDE